MRKCHRRRGHMGHIVNCSIISVFICLELTFPALISTASTPLTMAFSIHGPGHSDLYQRFTEIQQTHLVNRMVYFDAINLNHTRLVVIPNFHSIYAISNESSITQLNMVTLKLIKHFQLPDINTSFCPEDEASCSLVKQVDLLEKIVISGVEFPFLCYTYNTKYLNNYFKTTTSRNGCLVPQANIEAQPYLSLPHVESDGIVDHPHQRAFLSTKDGTIYLATYNNLLPFLTRASTPRINARLPEKRLRTLQTRTAGDAAFTKPTVFLKLFESEDAVYLLYKESWDAGCLKSHEMVTRIARVCKHDPGGLADIDDADKFGTFAKATLECTLYGNGKEETFQLSQAVDAQWREELKMLAVLFHGSSVRMSAVCLFELSEIERAFEGPGESVDGPVPNPMPKLCSQLAASPNAVDQSELENMKMFSMKYPSRHQRISAWSKQAIIGAHLTLWQRIVWQLGPQLPAEDYVTNSVLYVLSESQQSISGYHLQMQHNSGNPITACLYDYYYLPSDADSSEVIQDMLVNSIEQEPHLVLATNKRVLQFPLSHCSQLEMCSSDPYCRQLKQQADCRFLRLTSNDEANQQWKDYLPKVECDKMDNAYEAKEIVRKWKEEGHWMFCSLTSEDGEVGQKCWCQFGLNGLIATRCTVKGGWSSWSEWSACSNDCPVGVRQRTRLCNNPPPEFGGDQCEGDQIETEPCVSPTHICAGLTTLGWSSWSSWSKCAFTKWNECKQQRQRVCLAEGMCAGSGEDLKKCPHQNCSLEKTEQFIEEKSMWTPWMQDTRAGKQNVLVKFQYNCHEEEEKSRVNLQRKVCNPDGSACSAMEKDPNEAWHWSSWSACNVTCGEGFQQRERLCLSGSWCSSNKIIIQRCHQHSCNPLNSERNSNEEINAGLAANRAATSWSTWSTCHQGNQTRYRQCGLCQGLSQEYQPCDSLESMVMAADPQRASTTRSFNILHLSICFMVFLVTGVLISVLILCVLHGCRHKQQSPLSSSSQYSEI